MLFFLLSIAKACRRYECVDLGTDICAKLAEKTTMVNSVPCSAYKQCLVNSVEALEYSQDTDTLYCQYQQNYSTYNWNQVLYKCGTKKANRDFVSGQALISCKEDLDCALKDGSYTTCQCGADGGKYCVPSWDSQEFAGYWQDCANGISRTQLDFWILFKEFYPLWITSQSLPCIQTTIYEIQTMASYQKSFTNFLRLSYWVLISISS